MGACDSMLCDFEHDYMATLKELYTLHEKWQWDVLDGM
jgi:hypothetical protein